VDIDSKGQIIYRGRNVTIDKLDQLLGDQMQRAQTDEDRIVLVIADKGRPVLEIAAVADVIKGQGGTIVLVNQEGANTPQSPGIVKARP
jgi:biopolymer transport protein ExbD